MMLYDYASVDRRKVGDGEGGHARFGAVWSWNPVRCVAAYALQRAAGPVFPRANSGFETRRQQTFDPPLSRNKKK